MVQFSNSTSIKRKPGKDFGPYLWSIISELAPDEMKKRKRGKKKKKKEKGNDKRGISDKHNPTFPQNQGIYEYIFSCVKFRYRTRTVGIVRLTPRRVPRMVIVVHQARARSAFETFETGQKST